MSDKQELARRKLMTLLSKLGLESATNIRAMYIFEEQQLKMYAAFGQPDRVFLSPQAFAAYSAILRTNSPQSPDTEESGQSEEVPSDSRDQ